MLSPPQQKFRKISKVSLAATFVAGDAITSNANAKLSSYIPHICVGLLIQFRKFTQVRQRERRERTRRKMGWGEGVVLLVWFLIMFNFFFFKKTNYRQLNAACENHWLVKELNSAAANFDKASMRFAT